MTCRPDCGACCIAPSITSFIPGMPNGKPAGTPCVNLDMKTFACRIWNGPDYPPFCRGLQASEEMCGTTREEALSCLDELEELTRP